MSKVIIFVGPTLEPEIIKEIIPYAAIRPPVQCGDIVKALQDKPTILIIIDGFFENTLSVWHKEILYAIENGVTVIGASSMGALRAAELSAYGMIGVGAIFKAYASGELNDDDEVTVYHQDAARGYKTVSDAMVNIRATLQAALEDKILTLEHAKRLIALTKSQFYQQRNLLEAINTLKQEVLDNSLTDFEYRIQQQGLIDAKAADAKLALYEALHLLSQKPKKANLSLNQTLFFKQLLRDSKVKSIIIKSNDVLLEKYQSIYARLKYVCQDKIFPTDHEGALDFNWLYFLVLINHDEDKLRAILAAYKNNDMTGLHASEKSLLTTLSQLCELFKSVVDYLSENFVLPSSLGIQKYQQAIFEKLNITSNEQYENWRGEKHLTEQNVVELACYYFYYHLLIEAYNPHLLNIAV